MKKFYIDNIENLNEEEKRTGKISYARLCNKLFDNMILCNNIVDVDSTFYENTIAGEFCEYIDINGDYKTREEYENDTTGEIEERPVEIYQYYIVHFKTSENYIIEECGDNIILCYSDILDNYILCVDHFGSSWEDVITDIEYTTNIDDVL